MRVLQIIDGTTYGGISKIINDLTTNIKNIDFDYLTSINIKEDWNNLDISRKSLIGKIKYNHRLYKYLKKNKYDIAHINSSVFLFSFQAVFISKLAGVKRIIVHSHSTPKMNIIRKMIRFVLNPIYKAMVDIFISCSEEASKSLSKKCDYIIKNGIEIDKYKYNNSIRSKYRKELKLEDKIVYGHIGRFDKNKNQSFLIDIINKLDSDSVLLLIGDGALIKEIKNKVKKLKIKNKVIFLEHREDIGELLSAMDIFLFPSLSEGLGLVSVEAQTSGLPTIVSNAIPEIANISKNFIRVKNYESDNWINKIKNVKFYDRKNAYKDTIKNGYDIKECARDLKRIYRSLL